MFYVIVGAAVFAVGCLFGAWMILAGQQSKSNRASQKLQEVIAESMKKAANGQKHS